MLVQLRNDVLPPSGSTADAQPTPVNQDAPLAAFDRITYDQINGKAPLPPGPGSPK